MLKSTTEVIAGWVQSDSHVSDWSFRGPILSYRDKAVGAMFNTDHGKVAYLSELALTNARGLLESHDVALFVGAQSNVDRVCGMLSRRIQFSNGAIDLSSLMGSGSGNEYAALEALKTARCPLDFRMSEYAEMAEDIRHAFGTMVVYRDHYGFPDYNNVVALTKGDDFQFNHSSIRVGSIRIDSEYYEVFLVKSDNDAVAAKLKDLITYRFWERDK